MATKILHLDAALGVTKDGSNLVSQWNDQSGLNYHVVQGTTANKPIWVDAVLNGKPIIRFDGSNDYLNKLFGVTYAQPITIISVFKTSESNSGAKIILDGYNSSSSFIYGLNNNYLYGNVGVALLGTTQIGTSTYQIGAVKFNNTSSVVRLNSINETIGSTANLNGLNGVTIGARYNYGNAFNGDLAEIIVYSDITGQELFEVEQQLAIKYGLTYPKETLDFITLEEEQLYSPRLDEASVDFVTLEEEQLPLAIPELLSEAIVVEQDLDVLPLEVIVNEYISDELYPVSITVVEDDLGRFKDTYPCNKTVSTSNQSSNSNLWIDRGFVFVRTGPIIT